MPQVELDQDILDYLKSKIRDFGETPSSVLRRLLPIVRQPETLRPPVVLEIVNAPPPPIDLPSTGNQFFVRPHELSDASTAIKRFMLILERLYRWDPARFASVERVRGTTRIYFSRSCAALEASGNSVNPKKIAGTPYFVATNFSNEKKVEVMRSVLAELGLPLPKRTEILDLMEPQFMPRRAIELPDSASGFRGTTDQGLQI
jgi:negative modulator of initiation of replication